MNATTTGAPATVSTPAEAEAPKPIADLPDKFEDGSAVSDKPGAEKLFAGFEALAQSWKDGYAATRKATAAVCELTYQLRAISLRPDGKPDWAGQFQAYAALFEDRVTYVLSHTLGMDKDTRTAFRAAVRRYDSDNEFRKLFIARKLAEGDKGLGVKPEDIKPGFVAPAKLATALVKVAESQTVTNSKGETKFAPGFDSPQTFAQADQAIGVKKSQRTPTAEAVTATPTRSWQAIRTDVSGRTKDGSKPTVSYLASAEELHRTVSALALAIVGKPGEKQPSGLTERAKLVGSLTASMSVLAGLLAVLDTNSKVDKGEALADLWTDGDTK